MDIKDLLRYRNHVAAHLLPICDHLIHRHFRHIPILSDLLANPPPQDPIGRRPKKIFATECALEIYRIKIIDEIEKRERNAPYMGGVYKR